MRYEARIANGELYDAFVLRKRAGEFNTLVNQVPDTPEFRKPLVIGDSSAEARGAADGDSTRRPFLPSVTLTTTENSPAMKFQSGSGQGGRTLTPIKTVPSI